MPPGDVDDRSILEVQASDVRGYEQCHFFCGIAGWVLALEWAGWRGPVWTGSCPCQPLSSAGQRKGDADERHLWPAFQRLIAVCLPSVVFGEQVASKDGREWLSAVRTDLEQLGYACGAADLSAAGVGAPHIRQRLYWAAGRLADAGYVNGRRGSPGEIRGMGEPRRASTPEYASEPSGLADADQQGLSERIGNGGVQPAEECPPQGQAAGLRSPWDNIEWLPCADGKARPTQPGLHPLADGLPGRVGQLRAYGNAIVPALAAEFIRAFMETQCPAV